MVSVEEYRCTFEAAAASRNLSPLFLLPGLKDNDPEFDRVWLPLEDSLPVHRVNYLDWTDLVVPGSHFAEVVAFVKRQIEREVPVGPLRIAGYSIGGRVAYAVALAFQHEGRDDLRVAILDAPAISEPSGPSRGKKLHSLISNVLDFRVREVLASVIAKGLTKVTFRPVLQLLSRFRSVPLIFRFDGYLHPKITMQMELQLARPWWSAITRSNCFLTAPVFLFRSRDYDSVGNDDLGWTDFCSDCKVFRVPGDHQTMLQTDNNAMLLSTLLDLMTAGRPGGD
ncbi:thioesterase domain-containing protein [Acidisarcina polymorpha]|uniref:thioesterase domain-containing protein n=1 Tax=Acidisarcina polymorpha TaxID=2211140 RepID=UPI0013751521|nr:thioesterase domain-containing protein [Acidisarcina polymorpha]